MGGMTMPDETKAVDRRFEGRQAILPRSELSTTGAGECGIEVDSLQVFRLHGTTVGNVMHISGD
jgi:hypothetical protein